MSDKKFVCKLDNRRFRTRQALEQHSAESHAGRSKTAKSAGSKKTPQMAAPIATPQRLVSSATDVAKMTGVDRLASSSIRTNMNQGDVIVDLTIEPSVFKRLYLASRCYQRIKYGKLRFRVEPQLSTATSGGYVVGFIHDPDDDSKHLSLDVLTSQRGSVTTKWWQSASIDINVSNRLFFTNLGAEKREFSPGKLVVIVDGKPSLAGNFTVFCEWSAELTVATLDLVAGPTPPGPSPSDYKIPFAELWQVNRDGKDDDQLPRAWTKVQGVLTSSAAAIIPKAKSNAIYQLPGIYPIDTEANDHAQTMVVCLKVIDANTVHLVDTAGKEIFTQADEMNGDFQTAFSGKAKEIVLTDCLEDRIKQLENRLKELEPLLDGMGSDWDLGLRPKD